MFLVSLPLFPFPASVPAFPQFRPRVPGRAAHFPSTGLHSNLFFLCSCQGAFRSLSSPENDTGFRRNSLSDSVELPLSGQHFHASRLRLFRMTCSLSIHARESCSLFFSFFALLPAFAFLKTLPPIDLVEKLRFPFAPAP